MILLFNILKARINNTDFETVRGQAVNYTTVRPVTFQSVYIKFKILVTLCNRTAERRGRQNACV